VRVSTTLEIIIGLACISIIVLVGVIIPVALAIKTHLEMLTNDTRELKADIHSLIKDTQKMVQAVDQLTTRANQQMDEINVIVKTVHEWTDRTGRILNAVGNIVEPPLFAVSNKIGIVRAVVGAFWSAFSGRKS
jgi:uncharacterized protein YoxC